jgi:uncharacterized membrane protein YagU involved in acid resistance
VLTAGLIAGVLDITAAFVVYGRLGVTPARILRSVARGLVGARAATGGLHIAALGLVLHFVIACGAAAVYYAASRRWPALNRRPVVSGLVYGVVVWLVMNYVVVPLSAIGLWPTFTTVTAIIIVVHMLFVGLPIALVVGRGARERTR